MADTINMCENINVSNTGITSKIKEGFTQSTRIVQDINRANMEVVRADTKANFDEATTPDPGMVRFMETQGVGNKIKVIAENIKEGVEKNAEKERARREGIQSHESYRLLLEEQRSRRQAIIKHSYKNNTAKTNHAET